MADILRSKEDADAERTASVTASPSAQVQAFLRKAMQEYTFCVDGWRENRERMREDNRFRASDMWDSAIKAARQQERRPCLTIDKISGPIDQLVGIQRLSRPAIRIDPGENETEKESAEALEGLARAVQTDSHAEIAFDTAFEQSCALGEGAFRFYTEYASDEPGETAFDQVLKVGWIEDIFALTYDPAFQKFDTRDKRMAFLVSDLSVDEFRARYGQAQLASLEMAYQLGHGDPAWFSPGQRVRVAEYWYVEHTLSELVRLPTGEIIDARRVDRKTLHQMPESFEARPYPKCVVKRAVISATQILEGNHFTDVDKNTEGREWPGKWIPIFPVFGKYQVVEGKRRIFGLIRNARDPQTQANVMESAATEMVGTAPRSPWVAAYGQIQRFKTQWDTANLEPWSVLPYDPVEVNGHLVGPPFRLVQEPPIQAMLVMGTRADQNMREVMQFYNASDPTHRNAEQSGIAIEARIQQGQTTHTVYLDNLKRSMVFAGEAFVDLAPMIYGNREGRVVQVIGQDNVPGMIQIGTPETPSSGAGLLNRMAAGAKQLFGQMGRAPDVPSRPVSKPKVVSLKPGRYSVSVSVGASFSSRRKETVEIIKDLVKVFPPLAPIALDVLLENMDGPGMQTIAERAKTLLPPNLQKLEHQGGEGEEPIPAHAQAELDASRQMIEQLTAAVHQQNEIIQQKKIESHTKVQIEAMRDHSTMAVAALKIAAERDRNEFHAELAKYNDEMARLHELVMEERRFRHEDETERAGRTHDVGMAALGHRQALTQAEQEQEPVGEIVPPPPSASLPGEGA